MREMDGKGSITIIAPFPDSEDFEDPEVDDFVTDQDDDGYWDPEDPDSWTELPNPNPPASSPQNDPPMTIYNSISKGRYLVEIYRSVYLYFIIDKMI